MKKKILIVIADYYKDIADGLLKSALKLISKKNNIKVINVPGAFEIPVTISKNINKHDAFLALGCVIKGQTPHFDFISQAATNGIMKLSISSKKPIGNGIITCLNMSQAKARKKNTNEDPRSTSYWYKHHERLYEVENRMDCSGKVVIRTEKYTRNLNGWYVMKKVTRTLANVNIILILIHKSISKARERPALLRYIAPTLLGVRCRPVLAEGGVATSKPCNHSSA